MAVNFAANAATQVYRSVDDEGNVIFSDRPQANSQTQTIESPTIMDAQPDAGEALKRLKSRRPEYQKPKFSISSKRAIRILSPSDAANIRSNSGELSVDLALEKGESEEVIIELILDGLVIKKQWTASPIKLYSLDRGPHTLQAVLLDQNGKLMAQSQAVNFNILRATKK
ncbi:MAG: DUF4124 domain-containing protein [Gammaproteobacteria bacterium]|nr:DUF4124 domain-containing protein [Gammaproteobacteria bacterium]